MIVYASGNYDVSTPSNDSTYSSSDDSSSNDLSDDELSACTYAQIEMKNKLKAPASAENAACRYNTYESLGYKKYQVTSYVDASNSFGASMRTNYQCTVTLPDKGSDSYYISCDLL